MSQPGSEVSTAATEHCYVLEYFTEDGRRLGPMPIEPDWQCAHESAAFVGMRRGLLEPATAPATGRVSPVWSEEFGEPYCNGVRVSVTRADGSEAASCEVPNEYLKELASRNSAVWVEKGELAAGELYQYRLSAYPLATPHRARRGGADSLLVEPIADPIEVVESSLDAFLARAEPVGEHNPADAPVFIPQAVLEEAIEQATCAGDTETGSVLVGKLHRDPSLPEIFLEVTAQVAAQHAEASEASFTFTPETWAAAHAALELRDRTEHLLGWAHSHPQFCVNCPPERQRLCTLARPFFSSADVHVHRTCFGRGFHIALLISDLPESGRSPALFGWRNGMVVSRGFHAVH